MSPVKIVSWNVNGLRACAKTHFRDWFSRSDADVVLIQELRAEPEQLDPDLVSTLGYSSVFFPASSKKGYSGVAAWVRDSLGAYQADKGAEGNASIDAGRMAEAPVDGPRAAATATGGEGNLNQEGL